MMSKIEVALRSPAFWSMALLFIYHGLEGIAPSLSGGIGTFVQGLLALMALYFHPKEVQVAGATGKLGSASIRKL